MVCIYTRICLYVCLCVCLCSDLIAAGNVPVVLYSLEERALALKSGGRNWDFWLWLPHVTLWWLRTGYEPYEFNYTYPNVAMCRFRSLPCRRNGILSVRWQQIMKGFQLVSNKKQRCSVRQKKPGRQGSVSILGFGSIFREHFPFSVEETDVQRTSVSWSRLLGSWRARIRTQRVWKQSSGQ